MCTKTTMKDGWRKGHDLREQLKPPLQSEQSGSANSSDSTETHRSRSNHSTNATAGHTTRRYTTQSRTTSLLRDRRNSRSNTSSIRDTRVGDLKNVASSAVEVCLSKRDFIVGDIVHHVGAAEESVAEDGCGAIGGCDAEDTDGVAALVTHDENEFGHADADGRRGKGEVDGGLVVAHVAVDEGSAVFLAVFGAGHFVD
jgi:hypothetical protein